MTKIISIKELQTQTKDIRQQVEKGVRFVVVWRSRPVFEIGPVLASSFTADLEASGQYNDSFLKRMANAERDLKEGKTKTYKTTEEFLQSLV